MQTNVTTSPIDLLVEKLQANKHYREFRMTAKGFTKGGGHYYDPSDLTMVNMYSFQDTVHPSELSFVYILRDKNRVLGFSVDAFSDYSMNEANLYHWFMAKVPVDMSTNYLVQD